MFQQLIYPLPQFLKIYNNNNNRVILHPAKRYLKIYHTYIPVCIFLSMKIHTKYLKICNITEDSTKHLLIHLCYTVYSEYNKIA